ncbi:MAG: hypothetical protein R3A10_11570 [Caldilineaceae bacterium]
MSVRFHPLHGAASVVEPSAGDADRRLLRSIDPYFTSSARMRPRMAMLAVQKGVSSSRKTDPTGGQHAKDQHAVGAAARHAAYRSRSVAGGTVRFTANTACNTIWCADDQATVLSTSVP